jgi:hypothetical protein
VCNALEYLRSTIAQASLNCDFVPVFHRHEDMMDTKEEIPYGSEIANTTQGGSEEKEGACNDEKISEEKDMPGGLKV